MGVIAAAVRHMFRAGMEPDAIIAAVEDMEAASAPKPKSEAAKKRKRRKAKLAKDRKS